MKKLAISVRQPYAWFIVNKFKDVENRSWDPPEDLIGQRIYIHAGKAKVSKEEFEFWYDVAVNKSDIKNFPKSVNDFDYGCIVGSVKIDGVTSKGKKPWARKGMRHWLISGAKKIKPIEFKGQLKLFDVSKAFK